ncbi:hypothetical protein KP79_PYT22846 [Mizuhopecten yessoensis]|uniref:Uncharacterized protein n=1 Tax=Mizuhopecten yessoensis TaxID=6573 RepID=A0A210QGH2_MIZYE|nr:hypothetical protein KP79_PYT22846 [Mizuhopecten yessoensis]
MTHKPGTADSFYELHNRQKEASQVSQMITSTFSKRKESHQSDEEEHETEAGINDQHRPATASQDPEEDQSEACSVTMQHPRRSFSRSDSGTLLELCREMVEGSVAISTRTVILRTSNSSLANTFSAKQLVDRVRTARRGFLKGKLSFK